MQEGEELFHIGFYVAKSDGSGRRQLSLSRDQLVAKAAFEDSKTVSLDLTLEGSEVPYIVIPSTFNPESECKFTMTFTSEGVIGLEPLSPSKEWKHVSVEGEWAGKSAGGCKNNPTCPNNPQYLLQVTEPTVAHMLLVQNDKTEFDHIGFYVAKTGSPTVKLVKISTSDILGKAEFASCREAYWKCSLTPDKFYVIVPCTFDPGYESKFRLTVLSDNAVKIKKLQDAQGLSKYGEWTAGTAGGCINHSSWRDNPQFFLTVKKELSATITLKQLEENKMASIGFYIAKSNGRRQLVLTPSDLVEKGAFEKRKSISVEVSLQPAEFPYVIIPCTFYPNHVGRFSLSVSAHTNIGPTDLILKECKDSWKKIKAVGKWEGDTAGGCRNHRSWLKNPQFGVHLKTTCELVTILSQPNSQNSIGFYVIRNKEMRSMGAVKKEDIIQKSIFRKDEEVNTEALMDAGYYNIIPCLFEAGMEGNFELILYCQEEIEFEAFDETCSIIAHNDSPAGSSNHSGKLFDSSLVSGGGTEIVHMAKMQLAKEVERPQASTEEPPQLSPRNTVIEVTVEVNHNSNSNSNNATTSPNGSDSGSSLHKKEKNGSVGSGSALTLKVEPKEEKETTTGKKKKKKQKETLKQNKKEKKATPRAEKKEKEEGVGKKKKKKKKQKEEGATAAKGKEKTKKKIKRKASGGKTSPKSSSASQDANNSGSVRAIASGEAHPWAIDFEELVFQEKIGQGGFGVVYKGTWRGTTVAIKKLLSEDMDDPSDYQEFIKEIEIMSKLRHPNVVQFLGACLQPPNICIVTEFLEKGNLAEVLKRDKDGSEPLSWHKKIKMARQAAQGMNYLHQSKPKIVHRDLKSLNLLVDENLTVKVADFGLSKLTVTGNTLNSKVGSLNWCAPEILLQNMPYTDKADIYSFGMVLWELLTHEAPFYGLHPLQIVRAIDQGKLPDIPKTCPPDYAKLISDCWEKDPNKRPSFDEILVRLQKLEGSG
ncbi:Constitutive triple response 4 [Balamuthia mandrillaris]